MKEEKLRIQKLELELNQKKWEIEEKERKQRLLLDTEDAFLAALKPNKGLILFKVKVQHISQIIITITKKNIGVTNTLLMLEGNLQKS